jgi:RND family efflux transporter MFP subunit
MRARDTTRFFVFAGLAIAVVGCRTEAAPPPPPPTVVLATVLQKDVPLQDEWLATLDGFVNAQIKPQVTGYLTRQLYTEGMPVRRGDVLFEIDPRPFRAAMDQASAQLDQSRAQQGKAEQDVARNRPLAEARAIARSQLDNDIQAERAAKAASDSASASLRQARLNLGFTKVRSLVDGVAGIAGGQIGDLVGPTTVLTTVSQLDPIKAYISISEREYLRFAEAAAAGGQPVPGAAGSGDAGPELILGDGRVHEHRGRFVFADRQVDPTTGTIRVMATFPNPKHLLRPGQFGRVRAVTRVARRALLVPQRAVTELQGTYQVAVVTDDNRAQIRPVQVGERVGDLWIVESGVKAGERVVAEGVQKVRDGAPVRPVAAEPPAQPAPAQPASPRGN